MPILQHIKEAFTYRLMHAGSLRSFFLSSGYQVLHLLFHSHEDYILQLLIPPQWEQNFLDLCPCDFLGSHLLGGMVDYL